jgi:acyl-coenzyme A synthetase/AMP-(fatty) acid ligase
LKLVSEKVWYHDSAYLYVQVDTWWQTETGGAAISPRPSEVGEKIIPGRPMKPFFGINAVLLDDKVNVFFQIYFVQVCFIIVYGLIILLAR